MALEWMPREDGKKDHALHTDANWGTDADAPCVVFDKRPLTDPKGNVVEGLFVAWIRLNNPKQYNLISAHITLCREDEIGSIKSIVERIKSISLKKPIQIEFKNVEWFSDGKGILIPATDKNIEFRELRKSVPPTAPAINPLPP